MKTINETNLNVDDRVRDVINSSMTIYLNKLNAGYYSVGLEDSFKMYLANIIQTQLHLYTYLPSEKFHLFFEENMPIFNDKDYIDIVIKYENNNEIKTYPIELKFKKITDAAPDLGNIESYKDIYNLDRHKYVQKTENISNCYFIFLTDLIDYTKQSKKGTRTEIPMYDNYKIEKDKEYRVSGNAAKKNTLKYPNGFVFSNDYKIEYQSMKIKDKNFWFYILEI